MMSPFYLHIRPHFPRITGFFVHWAHATLGHAGFNILEALKILNASCLNKASVAFLMSAYSAEVAT